MKRTCGAERHTAQADGTSVACCRPVLLSPGTLEKASFMLNHGAWRSNQRGKQLVQLLRSAPLLAQALNLFVAAPPTSDYLPGTCSAAHRRWYMETSRLASWLSTAKNPTCIHFVAQDHLVLKESQRLCLLSSFAKCLAENSAS